VLRAAAAQTFAREGFADASAEEIAETAGFSIGALYSNFASKETSAESAAAVVAALFEGLARQRLIDPGRVSDEFFGLALKWIFTGIGAAEDNSERMEEVKTR
jgi:AcrR family transcriptional regulator